MQIHVTNIFIKLAAKLAWFQGFSKQNYNIIVICNAQMITLLVGVFYFNFQILPLQYPRECYIDFFMRKEGIWEIRASFVKNLTLCFVNGHAVCKS